MVTTTAFSPTGRTLILLSLAKEGFRKHLLENPLQENTNEPHVASLFTYGFIRGLLLSAFPRGELLMESATEAESSPIAEFIFKTNALYKDKFERERVKSTFNITKKL